MKKGNGMFILVFGLAAALFLFLYLQKDEKTFRWDETFEQDGLEPFDLSLTVELIKNLKGEDNFSVLDDSNSESLTETDRASYVFIGRVAYFRKKEREDFVKWVEKGNSALFVAEVIPFFIKNLIDESDPCHLNPKIYLESFVDTVAWANHLHPELNSSKPIAFRRMFKDKPQDYKFSYLHPSLFCRQSQISPLGALNEEFINFIAIPVGKGVVYFHSNPLFFTNYQLTKQSRLEYIKGVFRYLPEEKIIWDEYHKTNYNTGKSNYQSNQPDTPLSFVLRHKSLKWAFYILLSVALLYLIFNSQRKQRIIPVEEPLRNSSLEFVQALGRLYFLQRDHVKLLQIQSKYLLQFIRERYRIKAQSVADISAEALALRSGLLLEEIERLLNEYKRMRNYVEISDNEVISFYQLLNNFYKNCH